MNTLLAAFAGLMAGFFALFIVFLAIRAGRIYFRCGGIVR